MTKLTDNQVEVIDLISKAGDEGADHWTLALPSSRGHVTNRWSIVLAGLVRKGLIREDGPEWNRRWFVTDKVVPDGVWWRLADEEPRWEK